MMAAVQMLDVTGSVCIRELVTTARGWTLEAGPGGRKWGWKGGVGKRTMSSQQWSWGRSMVCGIRTYCG
jgi:hypothetical protein